MFQKTDDGTTSFVTDQSFTLATSHLLHGDHVATSAAPVMDNSAYSLPSVGTPSAKRKSDAVEAANRGTPHNNPHNHNNQQHGAVAASSSEMSSPNEPIEAGASVTDSRCAQPPSAVMTGSAQGGSTGLRPTWREGDAVVSAREAPPEASSVIVVEANDRVIPSEWGDGSGPVRQESVVSQGTVSQGTSNKRTRPKRSYGNLTPICGGRLLVNNDSWHSIVIAVIIFIVVVIFLAGVPSAHEWWTFLVVIVFALASIACVLLCVSVDPGVLEPRPVAQEPHKLNVLTKVTNKSGESFDVSCAVCRTCHIRRPPRSTHCQFCDVCVEEFDHHCGVLGSCVGKRTFRFFAGFFMTTSVLCLYVVIRSIVFLVKHGISNMTTPRQRFQVASAFISAIIPAFSLFMVVPCACVYLRYSCLNWTEKEHLRATNAGCCETNKPYDEGYVCNLTTRLCGPLGERHVQSEYWV